MANEKVLPLEQIAAASTPTDSARIVIHDSAGSANYIDLATLKRLVRESIQIGGRNLLKGTKDFTGWTNKTGGTISSDTHDGLRVAKCPAIWSGLYIKFTYEAGCSYVLSLYADKKAGMNIHPNYSGAKNVLGIETDAKITASAAKFTPCSDGWYRWSVSFECTKSGLGVIEIESTKEEALRFCGVKLERGNIPTDWTPAPEDFFWGGVKSPVTQIVISSCLQPRSKLLTIQRKGGRHECGQSGESHRGDSQRTAAGCSDEKRFSHRYGCLPHSRRLFGHSGKRHDKLSAWGIQIWSPSCICRTLLLFADIYSKPCRRKPISKNIRFRGRLASLEHNCNVSFGLAPRKEVVAA